MMTILSPSLVCRAFYDLLCWLTRIAASKCDDISCTEVIRALNLEDDPKLEDIEDRIDQYNEETSEWKKKKSEAEKSAKGLPSYTSSFCPRADDILAIEAELKTIREHLREYEEHLQALKDNKPFAPTLTGKSAKATATRGKKRKNSRGGKNGSPKKRRNSPDNDEDESMESDSDSDSDSDVDSDFASDKGSDDEQTDDESKSGSDSEGSDTGDDEDQSDSEVTEEDLKEKIKDTKEAVKSGRNRLSEARKQKKESVDYLSTLKKNITKAQKEKNAFCSLKRSEV
jgi:septal ring factor EnvC (AmiA/AmiB activator)